MPVDTAGARLTFVTCLYFAQNMNAGFVAVVLLLCCKCNGYQFFEFKMFVVVGVWAESKLYDQTNPLVFMGLVCKHNS